VTQGFDRDAQDAGLDEEIDEAVFRPAHEGDTEEIDAIAVPAGEGPAAQLAPRAPESRGAVVLSTLRSAPAVQAAALAAGGFVAGAAVVGLARRRHGGGAPRAVARDRRDRRGRRGRPGAGELLQIVGSRSLLVDVHLLDSAARGRR
jgi:hypothetical protein